MNINKFIEQDEQIIYKLQSPKFGKGLLFLMMFVFIIVEGIFVYYTSKSIYYNDFVLNLKFAYFVILGGIGIISILYTSALSCNKSVLFTNEKILINEPHLSKLIFIKNNYIRDIEFESYKEKNTKLIKIKIILYNQQTKVIKFKVKKGFIENDMPIIKDRVLNSRKTTGVSINSVSMLVIRKTFKRNIFIASYIVLIVLSGYIYYNPEIVFEENIKINVEVKNKKIIQEKNNIFSNKKYFIEFKDETNNKIIKGNIEKKIFDSIEKNGKYNLTAKRNLLKNLYDIKID